MWNWLKKILGRQEQPHRLNVQGTATVIRPSTAQRLERMIERDLVNTRKQAAAALGITPQRVGQIMKEKGLTFKK
jgi:hypothetical protein